MPSTEDMIYDAVMEVRDDVKEMKNCLTNVKLDVKGLQGEVSVVKDDVSDLEKSFDRHLRDFDNHKNNPNMHYKDNYQETFRGRIKRHKGEISVNSIISAVIYLLLDIINIV